MSVYVNPALLDRLADEGFRSLIDFDQCPWLIADATVPIMGWWEEGKASFDPTVNGFVYPAMLTRASLEITLLDGSLIEVPITEAAYTFPCNIITFDFDLWVDHG
jgi:hypothetical protein